MTLSRAYSAWGLVALLVVAGCSGTPTMPSRVKTGAEEVAREYFEALAHKDWVAAYKLLDGGSRTNCSSEQFAKLAQNWDRNLGFEPTEVHVQSCEERDSEATAHVNLKGVAGSSLKFYRDAIGLRRGATGWAVLLPSKFGMVKPGKS